MSRQLDLFGALPREKRRRLMHAIDAGQGWAKFECRCGYRSPWLRVATLGEAMRGRPCPPCNGLEAEGGAA
jgi:hypothetical protein